LHYNAIQSTRSALAGAMHGSKKAKNPLRFGPSRRPARPNLTVIGSCADRRVVGASSSLTPAESLTSDFRMLGGDLRLPAELANWIDTTLLILDDSEFCAPGIKRNQRAVRNSSRSGYERRASRITANPNRYPMGSDLPRTTSMIACAWIGSCITQLSFGMNVESYQGAQQTNRADGRGKKTTPA